MKSIPITALAWAALSATVASGQSAAEPEKAPPQPPFLDVAREAGITFRHNSAPEKRYILESMSGGVALFDYNDDGLVDIYFVNALTVDTASNPKAARSALYKNLGGMKFEDVTDRAGVGYPGWGMGVCVADVDGDNRQDLYVTNVGPDRLYRNRGDGTFEDITQEAGIVADRWSAGCGFADYDRDGDLDLFVSRYVEVSLESLPEFGKGKFCQYRGVEVQCGPRGLPGTSDLLFRNDGRGRFEEVGKLAGVSDPNEYFGMGIAWLDHNRDGWPDLFVANDSGPNFLYRNKKNGTFEDEAFPMGVAVSEDGGEQGSMGVALGDYKNEGRLSLFVTNFSEEYNTVYYQDGEYFTDVSFRSATAQRSFPYVGWGTEFLDYDNDGWLDLVVVNGHVYPQLEHVKMGASAPYRQRKLLYRSRRDGTFEEIGESSGDALAERRVSRGLAVGDLDNDGRLDLVINDLDSSPQVLHNQVQGSGNWLIVKLEGSDKMTDAIGATITIRTGARTKTRTAGRTETQTGAQTGAQTGDQAGDQTGDQIGAQVQTRLIRSGTSYLSQNDMRQHFGLGAIEKIDSIEIRWPNGTITERKDVAANQILVLRQD